MKERLMLLLEQPRWLEEELVFARRETAAALDRCRRITGRYGPEQAAVPPTGSSGPQDAKYALLCELTEQEEHFRRELQEAQEALDAFLEQVRTACSFRCYCVLRWHYRLYQPWEEVRKNLQETFGFPVTMRTVYNWHRAALREAGKLLEKK